jgi:hypothetical protein
MFRGVEIQVVKMKENAKSYEGCPLVAVYKWVIPSDSSSIGRREIVKIYILAISVDLLGPS